VQRHRRSRQTSAAAAAAALRNAYQLLLLGRINCNKLSLLSQVYQQHYPPNSQVLLFSFKRRGRQKRVSLFPTLTFVFLGLFL